VKITEKGGKLVQATQTVIKQEGIYRIIVTDTAGTYDEKNKNDVVVDGSHFGVNSGRVTAKAGVRGRIGNDAGIGKNNAGIAGLKILEEHGIPGAAISCMSAKIGVGMSTYETGKISVVNKLAKKLGIKPGMSAKEAAEIMFRAALKPKK